MKKFFVVKKNGTELFKSEDFSEVKQWIYDNDDVKELVLRSKTLKLDDDEVEEDIDYEYGTVEVYERYFSTVDILKALSEYNCEDIFKSCIEERREKLLEEYFWDELFYEIQIDWDANHCENGDVWNFDCDISIHYVEEEEDPMLLRIEELEKVLKNMTTLISNVTSELNTLKETVANRVEN